MGKLVGTLRICVKIRLLCHPEAIILCVGNFTEENRNVIMFYRCRSTGNVFKIGCSHCLTI
jgi:hypothetical protein